MLVRENYEIYVKESLRLYRGKVYAWKYVTYWKNYTYCHFSIKDVCMVTNVLFLLITIQGAGWTVPTTWKPNLGNGGFSQDVNFKANRTKLITVKASGDGSNTPELKINS